MDTLARLWLRNCDQLFPRNYGFAFPLRRFPGSGTRIHDYTLPSADPTVDLRRAKADSESPTPFDITGTVCDFAQYRELRITKDQLV